MEGILPWYRLILPSLLLFCTPTMTLVVWDTAVNHNGDYWRFFEDRVVRQGVVKGLWNLWTEDGVCTPFSLALVLAFMSWSLLLMWAVPGKRITGPVTPHGNVPEYKDNGFACFIITMVAFCLLTLALKWCGLSPSVVYDHYREVLVTTNILAHLFCLLLYVKGLYFPSSTDSGTSHWFIFDYYWGTELYPRIAGFDVKVFTNCRFGLMAWTLTVCCFAIKSHELHGFRDSVCVTTLLQLLYLTKFYWWEGGYYQTLDIILDRAGFYICWGCMCFVPAVYNSTSLYLVEHPVNMGHVYNGFVLFVGVACLVVNYWADSQKQVIRHSSGQCLIWGNKPTLVRAKYKLASGEERENLLLASGWWGLSRHFHYLPELGLAFCWSATNGMKSLVPFTYFLILTVLLLHRSFRDEEKCSLKYGASWEKYKKLVPYRIVPLLF